MKALSLGWGVQSFTLAAMVALGDLEPVDVAIHADTTHESKLTYEFAARWTPWLEERGVRVVTVANPTVRITTDREGGENLDTCFHRHAKRSRRHATPPMHPPLEGTTVAPLAASQPQRAAGRTVAWHQPGRIPADERQRREILRQPLAAD